MINLKMDSEEKYRLDTCMDFILKHMRNVGCWPKFYEIPKMSEILYLFYCAFMLGSCIIFIGEQSYGMVLYSAHWISVSDAFEDIMVLLSAVVVVTKVVTVIWNQKSLLGLIDRINKCWNVKYITTDEEREMIQNGMKHEKRITKIFSTILNGVAFSYLLLSVLQITRRVREARSDFLGLQNGTAPVLESNKNILIVKYPFKLTNMAQYVFSYIHIKAVLVTLAQGTTCVDCITWCLMYYLGQHMMILARKVRKNLNEAKDSPQKAEKEIVEYHLELSRCVCDIQSIFGPVLLLQFTLTSSMICLGVYQMTQVRSMSLMLYIKNFFYVLWKFTQLYMHCWYGQKLTDQSLRMTPTIYSTNWYTCLGKQNGKLIMMVRGQKPFKLTAAGCFNVSLATFMTVLQSSYSFLALLFTVTHKDSKSKDGH